MGKVAGGCASARRAAAGGAVFVLAPAPAGLAPGLGLRRRPVLAPLPEAVPAKPILSDCRRPAMGDWGMVLAGA